jgi:predicted transcriptional regulator
MLEVRDLIRRIVDEPRKDGLPWHQQTVKIREEVHQKLAALARYTGQSKSGLASLLLAAAVEEAIRTLDDVPSEKLRRFRAGAGPMSALDGVAFKEVGGGEYLPTAAVVIRTAAEEAYTQVLAAAQSGRVIEDEDDVLEEVHQEIFRLEDEKRRRIFGEEVE